MPAPRSGQPVATGLVWDWLEDETLFSWCGRFHRCAPWPARITAVELFGRSGAVKFRTAPSGIDHFVRATHGLLGDAPTILRTRTVVGLYAGLADGQGWHLDQANCSSHKYGAVTAPRYCQSCLQEHREIYGVGLWRLPHQLPGTAVCMRHAEPLRIVCERRFAWHLPQDLPSLPIQIRSTAELQTHLVAAGAMQHIFQSAADVRVLARRALGLLCEHYRVVDGKHLVPDRLQADWSKSHLGRWVAREAPALRCCKPGWITDTLRRRRSERNPLRWAYMTAFLKELGVAEPAGLLDARQAPTNQMDLWEGLGGVSCSVLGMV